MVPSSRPSRHLCHPSMALADLGNNCTRPCHDRCRTTVDTQLRGSIVYDPEAKFLIRAQLFFFSISFIALRQACNFLLDCALPAPRTRGVFEQSTSTICPTFGVVMRFMHGHFVQYHCTLHPSIQYTIYAYINCALHSFKISDLQLSHTPVFSALHLPVSKRCHGVKCR